MKLAMTQDSDKYGEQDVNARFEQTLKRLVNTPPRPHKAKEGREPKPAPKQA